mmetsp:Transcript_24730/g.30885  ORF Transcript_24730/g.30885 Transcript_24730/m.30885 type:complete len:326 (+) Transcript_24730:279-1256(+)
MNVLRGVLAMASASVVVNTTILQDVPASLGLVGEENMCAVVPSEPAVHALGETPGVALRILVHPVGHGALETVSVRSNLLRELTLQSGEHIIEGERVRREVHPAGVGSEDGEGLSGPETVRLAPVGDIRVELAHVASKTTHVVLPEGSARGVEVLLEDARPLLACNALLNGTNSRGSVHGAEGKLGSVVNVSLELLVSFVVLVIQRTALVLDDTGEAIKVGRGSGSCDLGTITVTANGSQSDLSLIHEADDVGAHILHIVGLVVVRAALVAIVEEPDVADVEDFVFALAEELLEVLCRFRNLREPNHGRKVSLATLQESALEFDI